MRIDKLLYDRPDNRKTTGIAFETPEGIHLKGVVNRSFENESQYQDYLKEHGIISEPATDNPALLNKV